MYDARELTYALLKCEYGLDLALPIDQLCPPVPNRANYIHWLRDLLAQNSPQLLDEPVSGIDMYAPLVSLLIREPADCAFGEEAQALRVSTPYLVSRSMGGIL